MPRIPGLYSETPMKVDLILRVVAVVLFCLAAAGMWGVPLVPLGLAMWCLATVARRDP